jgi:hypothetical protein
MRQAVFAIAVHHNVADLLLDAAFKTIAERCIVCRTLRYLFAR